MYEEFYGLRTNPFTLLPAPGFLYESRKHALGVSLLEYAVERRLLLSMITGEVGSGKTTIVRKHWHVRWIRMAVSTFFLGFKNWDFETKNFQLSRAQ